MMPGFEPAFFFNFYEQYMSQMFLHYNQAPIETTSADGKPLLTPSQFFSLASHPDKSPRNSLQDKISKQTIQKKFATKSPNQTTVIDVESCEAPHKNKENEHNDDLEVIEPLTKKIKPNTSSSPCAGKGNTEKSAKKSEVADEQKKKKLNKVVKVISSKRGELLFGVTRQAENAETDEVLTREEILKEDPMLLVYYYEKHLLFDNVMDFDPAKLTKI